MSELILRPASAGDIPAVLAFWQAAAENADRPTDTADAVAALIARDADALLLALAPRDAVPPDPGAGAGARDPGAGAELVGTVIAGWDGWRCHVYRLAVAPDRRRQGIGRALIEAAERRFRAFGGIRVDAMVLDDNDRAHGIWQANGYAPQAGWSRWIKPLTE